jgi:L-alanine-DL-glutamate epimerase-like enolase superfamily enzyme
VLINDIEFLLVEVPRTGDMESVRSLLVRLTVDSGLEGWGESGLAWRSGELAARRGALLPVLAGRSVFDIEELHTIEALAPASLRAAVEMACWDLMARSAGEPLCRLLGGEFRLQVPLAVRLTGRRPERVAWTAREMAAQGFACHVLASAGRADLDGQRIAAVREALGDRLELRFDGQSCHAPETARDLCGDIEDQGIRFFLDPLTGTDFQAMAALGRQTRVPLAISRSLRRPSDVFSAARSAAAQVVVLDPERMGGLAPTRAAVAVASAAGMSVVLGGRPSLGIGTAAMLHLAAAMPALAGANESAYPQLPDDILAEPLEIMHGMMSVPRGAGLGVEVERAKVERHAVD